MRLSTKHAMRVKLEGLNQAAANAAAFSLGFRSGSHLAQPVKARPAAEDLDHGFWGRDADGRRGTGCAPGSLLT